MKKCIWNHWYTFIRHVGYVITMFVSKLKFSVTYLEKKKKTFYYFNCPGSNLTGPAQFLLGNGSWKTIGLNTVFIWWHFIFLMSKLTLPGYAMGCYIETRSVPWAHLNIKMVFSGMGIYIIKIRWSWDRLIYIMEISILVRRHHYIETEPWFLHGHSSSKI